MGLMNPPNFNGVATLIESEILSIKEKLEDIIDGFTPTINKQVIDNDYIVSKYNKDNEPKINGDTAQFILGYLSIDTITESEGN